jgi:hypothetical protein
LSGQTLPILELIRNTLLSNPEQQALETAALMLGTDKSRGYCLEMICADFLAGANLENGNPDALLLSLGRLFALLPHPQKREFLEQLRRAS